MKIYDTVICVDTDYLLINNDLTLNKTYTTLNISDEPTHRLLILNDFGKQEWYYNHRFISLKQQRKNKILQLWKFTI